jgi:hypothetical protein
MIYYYLEKQTFVLDVPDLGRYHASVHHRVFSALARYMLKRRCAL